MTAGLKTNHGPTEAFTRDREGHLRHAGGAALAAVVLLAIALRLYRLGDQSLWFDDFLVFGHLNAPDLQSYLMLVRVEFPELGATPLYYALQYCFGKWGGMSAETPILLPVALSVSAAFPDFRAHSMRSSPWTPCVC